MMKTLANKARIEQTHSGAAHPRPVMPKKGKTIERIDLPLSQFTFAQKLDLMEIIWGELARDEKALESPAWHEAVLRDRKKPLEAVKATVSDWEEAKDRIRKNISCK